MSKKEALDHKCIVCGTRYHSCDTCERIKSYTPWRTLCDSFDCYKVYLVIRSYQEGLATKEEARNELAGYGVTETSYAEWPESTKKYMDEIFAASTKKKKVTEETAQA